VTAVEVGIGSFDEFVDGAAAYRNVDGTELCVVRIGAEVHAVGDVCTHQDISLSEGEVDVDTCHIECWKHGSSFSLRTGEPDALPATRPVPVYPVRVADGEVLVTLPDPAAEVAP